MSPLLRLSADAWQSACTGIGDTRRRILGVDEKVHLQDGLPLRDLRLGQLPQREALHVDLRTWQDRLG